MSPRRAQPTCRAFSLPKRGHSAREYEDAFYFEMSRGRAAVADGASESSFCAEWAGLLAQGFADAEQPTEDFAWIGPLRRRWAEQVDDLVLPWYAEDKRALGAAATLLGLALEPDGKWRAVAIGDSCLFHLQAGAPTWSFPCTRADSFTNHPDLVYTRSSELAPVRAEGRWRKGDRMLLATDALSQYFLALEEAGGDMAEELSDLVSQAAGVDFAAWIDERRRRGLRNDDVTLLILE